MKTLKFAILLVSIFAISNNFAKSPHESDSFIQGKVIATETNFLESEVARLTLKLEKTLDNLPLNIEHNEGKIIAIISNQVENELKEVKKDIGSLSYQRSSDLIYSKLEQIEKDIEMI